MASNSIDLLVVLKTNCRTLNELDEYVYRRNIPVNLPAVVARRNELLTDQFISDTDTYRLLQCCCNTLTELQKLIMEHQLDRNDAAVRAREQFLQVCSETKIVYTLKCS